MIVTEKYCLPLYFPKSNYELASQLKRFIVFLAQKLLLNQKNMKIIGNLAYCNDS